LRWLLTELKRRNVIRMAGLYLVGAWVITQVAATLLPVFEAPAWAMKSVVATLAAGFLPALAFAWVFEFTPDGLQRDSGEQPTLAAKTHSARRMERSILALLLVALSFFAFDQFYLSPHRAASERARALPQPDVQLPSKQNAVDGTASIAVLPFVNMSTDAENGFFADGISEELLNVLAGVRGLKVASRTSAFSFKGKDIPIPEIARQLGVDHVLEGSVRKQGQRVRITAQLINAATDTHLWSETYDRDLTDIFAVQEEIAQAITQNLQGILGQRQVTVAASTTNVDAYQRFLSGRARFHQRTELPGAIDDLTRAVELDPKFVEAWIYLAATWTILNGYTSDPAMVAKARVKSRETLQQAESLAPGDPMVLAIRSVFLQEHGDQVGGLALGAESTKLSVQDPTPLTWHGIQLLMAGYVDEAIAILEKAQKRDPLAGVTNGYLALAYLASGQYERAAALAAKASAQGWEIALRVIVFDLAARGESAKALAITDQVIATRPAATAEERKRETQMRTLLANPHNEDAFAALLEEASGDVELGIISDRFEELLERLGAQNAADGLAGQRQMWMRSAWMPSTLNLRTSPHFFAIAEKVGMVQLWETRGYPAGCKRAKASGGDHLECPSTAR